MSTKTENKEETVYKYYYGKWLKCGVIKVDSTKQEPNKKATKN